MVQGIQVSVASALAQVFMLLRIYALSRRSKPVLVVLAVYIAGQISFSVFLLVLTKGKPGFSGPDIPFNEYHSKPFVHCLVPEPKAFSVCALGNKNTGLDIIYVYMSLVFDAVVFFATLGYTIKDLRAHRSSHLLHTLMRDGTLYFLLIFSGNFVWVLCLKYGRVCSAPLFHETRLTCSRLARNPVASGGVSCSDSHEFNVLLIIDSIQAKFIVCLDVFL